MQDVVCARCCVCQNTNTTCEICLHKEKTYIRCKHIKYFHLPCLFYEKLQNALEDNSFDLYTSESDESDDENDK